MEEMEHSGYENYSVLMSVYYKENPNFLRQAIDSMMSQTICTNDFVLVCDGPLTEELDCVVEEFQKKYPDIVQILRLEKNMGLGCALNAGLTQCRNELVARMDSDDISLPERCEKQLEVFKKEPSLSIMSGTVLEFKESPRTVTGKRILPELHNEICRFSHKRNPFNHPAVMFKKNAVIEAGGYREKYHLFEDYDLWVRMLQSKCRGYNLSSPLLYMRTSSDMYLRRGGKTYARDLLQFHRWLEESGWITKRDFIVGALPHAFVCILPNQIRGVIYKILH